ncbi:hypothetical protein [Rhizobium tubonense]|uniref:Uncharacterized protein n=1 Tax=Rhizobium tubonense TaxID=484088 RepID=A0A2W4CSW9_9HYPH|nr:hypothetical protein [Rhizobium tubonense]PZM15502.1 hypothetical protein CPY51_06635 [Rhizobium tubonense]
MPAQTADIVDFQAYRQSRSKSANVEHKAAAPVSFSMHPMLMWMPFWGFVPVLAVGVAGYGS